MAKKKTVVEAMTDKQGLSWDSFRKTDIPEYTVKLDTECYGIEELKVKHYLDVSDMSGFVKSVVDMVIDYDASEYSAELFDLAIRLAVMHYYAGIPFPNEDQIVHSYNVLYGTDLYWKIYSQVDIDQISVMRDAIHEKVDFYKQLMLSVTAGKMGDLLAKMDDVLSISGEMSDTLLSGDFMTSLDNLASLAETLSGENGRADNKPAVKPAVKKKVKAS